MIDDIYVGCLTPNELLLLDGKTRPEVQSKIDELKKAISLMSTDLTEMEARFVAAVIKEAETEGRLIFRRISLRCCNYSGKISRCAVYKRTSRHHMRGEINYDKPLHFPGVELAHRFIRMEGSATLGCSIEFWNTVKPKLIKHLEDIKAEIPEQITGYPPKWKWFQKRKCNQCGWIGHEGQMLDMPAIMGGYYPGGCPKCDAKNTIFSNTINIISGFELVPVENNNV